MVLLSKASTPNTCYWSWVPLVTLFSGECHRASLMKSQLWFRKWLGAVRQQAITWANFGPDICRHVASLVRQDFRTYHEFAILMLYWNWVTWLQTVVRQPAVCRCLASAATHILIYQLRMFKIVLCIISFFKSLGPSNAIWWQKLAHVMACCLTAPRHYLNQCWLIISKV